MKHLNVLTYAYLTLSLTTLPVLAAGQTESDSSPETDNIFDFADDIKFKSDFPFEMNIFVSPGYQKTPLSSINALMSDRGYAPISEDMLAFGGGVQVILWHVINEWEGGGALTAPVSNQNYWSQLSSGYFFWNLGYQFKPLKELSIYPLLGLGINSLELNFTQRSRLPDFGEFLDNPGWQGSISNTLFALNLGLGVDWHWGWFGWLGLRGGYLFTPLASNWWNINDLQGDEDRQGPPLSNGPALNLNGPYLRLNLGF